MNNMVKFDRYMPLVEQLLFQKGSRKTMVAGAPVDPTAVDRITGYIYLEQSPDPSRLMEVRGNDLEWGMVDYTPYPMDDAYKIVITKAWHYDVRVTKNCNSLRFQVDENDKVYLNEKKGPAFQDWIEDNCVDRFAALIQHASFITEKEFDEAFWKLAAGDWILDEQESKEYDYECQY